MVELAPPSPCDVGQEAVVDEAVFLVQIETQIYEVPEQTAGLRDPVAIDALETVGGQIGRAHV